MATSKLTIIGMENYLAPGSVFNGLVLPAGIDKDIFIDSVILRGGEFELIYADADFLKLAVPAWGRKWYRTFSKWYEALQIEYEPLNNYDRTEEWTENESGSSAGSRDLSDSYKKREDNAQSGSSTDTGSGDSTDQVSAYNSSVFENDRKNTSSSSGSTSTTAASTGKEDSTRNEGEKTANSHVTANVRKGRAYGNIGVTTSQQMLESELDIAQWNLYEHMADIFISEFMIPVYY